MIWLHMTKDREKEKKVNIFLLEGNREYIWQTMIRLNVLLYVSLRPLSHSHPFSWNPIEKWIFHYRDKAQYDYEARNVLIGFLC